jgi:CubicO group peptidase (beta-lactamase class C family)
MREWIEQQLELFEVPGLAVAIVQNGETILYDGFGVRDRERGLPVTADTSFAIASATKAFTAAGVGALVDDGLLDWDEPVRHYLRDFQLMDPVTTERITVRDMLCHRSGLPRHELEWYGDESTDRADAVRRLRFLAPNADFRTTFQYNNLMYLTAGYLCEVVSGKSWEDVLRDRVLGPLDMKMSAFSVEEALELGDVAVPYMDRKDVLVEIPYAPGSHLCAPAGAIHSTLADMTNWMRVHLAGGVHEGAQVLSAATVRELHAPQMVMPEAAIFPEARDSAYGLGWFIGNYRGHKLVHHGGNIDGFTSLVTMLPEDGVGVVFLSNKDGTPLRSALSYHVFDELLGLGPIPWERRVKDYLDAIKGGAKEARARVARRADSPPSRPLAEFAGDYEHPAYGRFSVSTSDDGQTLVPRFRELVLELEHRHFDTFNLLIERFETMQMTATFRTAPDGEVAGIEIPFEPTVDPIVFERLPDAELTDETFLTALEGSYTMGPLTLEVRQTRPGTLAAQLTGQSPWHLTAYRNRTFKVAEMQSASLTFNVGDDGAVREVLLQPVGVFVPAQ